MVESRQNNRYMDEQIRGEVMVFSPIVAIDLVRIFRGCFGVRHQDENESL